MTDTKFDPNATPQCDLWRVQGYCSNANDMPEESFVYYNDACILERRALVAKEKLRIAVEALRKIRMSGISWEHPVELAHDALMRIEEVGK